MAAGPGWESYPQMLEGFTGTVNTSVWPDAVAVLRIAQFQFAAGELVTAAEALPNYVRDKVTQ